MFEVHKCHRVALFLFQAYVTSLKAKDLLGGVGAVINAVLLQLLPPDAEDWGVHDIEVGMRNVEKGFWEEG